jgi:acyl-CoA thioesterase-1
VKHFWNSHGNTLLYDVDSRKKGMFESMKQVLRPPLLFRVFGILLSLATSLISTTRAGGEVTETRKTAQMRVVILGDSITAGYGLERHEAFPAVLQKKVLEHSLPFEIVAAGVSGDTTAGGLRRVKWAFGKGAAVFVIALGGNDGLRGLPPGETEENLTNIIKSVRALDPQTQIVLAGMKMPLNLGGQYVAAFNSVFPKVAAAHQTIFVPFLLEGVGGVPALNQPDMIHPTAEGQRLVAEVLWQTLGPVLRKLASK